MTSNQRRGGAATGAPMSVARDPKRSWRQRDRLWGYVFVGPQLIGMLVFVLFPFGWSVVLSFASWNGLSDLSWVGFDNFKAELADPLMLKSIVNTLVIALVTVPIGLALALILAVALQQLRRRALYMVLFFAPVVTSTVAVAMIWQQMFRSDGILSATISKLFGIDAPNWLGSPHLALIAVCIVAIWGSLGLNIVIFMAGLQNIPPTVLEAARLDGAGPVTMLTRIRLPLLSPIVFFSIVVAVISSLQTFDTVYVLTKNAGPDNATRTIVYHIYDLGFHKFQFGLSSAAAVILLVLTLVITGIQFLAQKRFVYYEGNDQ